jgi:hypothetical protein
MASAGKVTADEIKETAQRVPMLRAAMERAFGTSNTEIIQKAGISGKQFVEVITNELLKLPKVTGGVQNAFENFRDSMEQSLAEIGKAILPDVVRGMQELEAGVKRFIEWWKKLPEETRINIVRFGEFALLIGPLILAIGSLASAVTSLTTAIATLKTVSAFLRTPGGLIGAGVIGAGAVIAKVVSDINNAIDRGKKEMYDADRRERTSQPRSYWEKQIREAQGRIAFARTNPLNNAKQRAEQIAANQAMIANAQRQMKGDLAARVMGPPNPPAASLDPMAVMARQQIAAGQREAAARKAEAAQRKAEAEANRRQAAAARARRIVVGRNQAQFDLFAGNEAASRTGLDAMLQDWTKQALQQRKTDRGALAADFVQNMAQIGENILTDLAKRGKEVTSAARVKKMMGATSSFLGGASNALSAAMGTFSPLAQKAAEITAARRIALEEKVQAHAVRMGRTSLSQYQVYLEQRLAAVQGNIDEEIRIEAELQQVKFQLMEDTERKRFRGWQNLARGLENVFATAFYDVLAQGKDFFSAFLDAFKQMVAQMLAAALAAGLMRALFGGGNFLTGFLSVFGFDSAGNDAKAHRWGFDFARNFNQGAFEHSRSAAIQGRGRMAMAGAGAGAGNVTVHLSGPVTINNAMDVRTLGEQLGLATRNALRRRV